MLTLNTNLCGLIAQSSLKTSTTKLNQAIERMTTGFKINHASDNAANYSISTNMSTEINAYQVAEDNAAMGLDLISTASGALDEISDKLSRLRVLQEQAKNGTYGNQSLKAINSEVNALVDEINRLYSTTEYNGVNLFTGTEVSSVDSAFISNVVRRDTTNMATLQSVDGDKFLDCGTYSISSAEELAKLAEMTNNGLIDPGTEFVLANDIDLSAYSNWTPIGTATVSGSLVLNEQDVIAFEGCFDGNGYTISNLSITDSANDISGLFGVAYGARIINTAIENVSLTDSDSLLSGALVGRAVGCYISNCYSTDGNIGGISRVGGLAAFVYQSIMEDCYSDCNASGSEYYVGGLAGIVEESSKVSNSFATGDVFCGKNYGGGLVGSLVDEAEMSGCYSTSKVSGYKFIAGLAGGFRTSKIDNCYYKGDVSGTLYSSGLVGFVAYSAEIACKISNCSVLSESDSIQSVMVGWLEGDGSILNVTNCHYSASYDASHKPLYKKNLYAQLSTFEASPIESSAIPFTIDTSSKTKLYNTETEMQIGINGSESSRIGFNTGYMLNGVDVFRNMGFFENDYLDLLDAMLNDIWNKQTEFGAAQNRLESALDEISIRYDNLVSSRSTLRDADIAEVSSTYIQQQILQQASATLLATANQSPSIALQLI